jgi:hypothetical protein
VTVIGSNNPTAFTALQITAMTKQAIPSQKLERMLGHLDNN